MKRLLLLAGFLTLLVTSAKADNDSSYFTMGVNDTVYINPLYIDQVPLIPVNAHFVSRFDSWIVWMAFPTGLKCTSASRGTGMNVPYIASNGTDSVFMAELTFNHNSTDTVFSASTTAYGYWDPDSDGIYSTYGLVKWEPGNHEPIFITEIEIENPAFRQGYISIMGHMTASDDLRGGTGDEWFSRSIFVKIGYKLGDVNGDGYIDSGDVSMLNNFVIGRYTPTEFQFEAGDINGDGELDVDDVALLIRRVLGMQSLDDLDM